MGIHVQHNSAVLVTICIDVYMTLDGLHGFIPNLSRK